MTTVPAHHELKWPRLEVTPRDFAACCQLSGRTQVNDEKRKGKVFRVPDKFTLPKSLNFKVASLKKTDRAAGTSANHRAAAATAWVMSNASGDFSNAPMLWTGRLTVIYILKFFEMTLSSSKTTITFFIISKFSVRYFTTMTDSQQHLNWKIVLCSYVFDRVWESELFNWLDSGKLQNHIIGGVFLLKRYVYQNNAGKAILCFGFHTYAALGVALEKKTIDGKDCDWDINHKFNIQFIFVIVLLSKLKPCFAYQVVMFQSVKLDNDNIPTTTKSTQAKAAFLSLQPGLPHGHPGVGELWVYLDDEQRHHRCQMDATSHTIGAYEQTSWSHPQPWERVGGDRGTPNAAQVCRKGRRYFDFEVLGTYPWEAELHVARERQRQRKTWKHYQDRLGQGSSGTPVARGIRGGEETDDQLAMWQRSAKGLVSKRYHCSGQGTWPGSRERFQICSRDCIEPRTCREGEKATWARGNTRGTTNFHTCKFEIFATKRSWCNVQPQSNSVSIPMLLSRIPGRIGKWFFKHGFSITQPNVKWPTDVVVKCRVVNESKERQTAFWTAERSPGGVRWKASPSSMLHMALHPETDPSKMFLGEWKYS